MKLKCIATGSTGNTYALISNTGEILLLDLGVSEKTIKKGIDWKISNVVGAVISHGHKDHSLSVEDFKSMGIPVAPLVGAWIEIDTSGFAPSIGQRRSSRGSVD